jgi:hypothetical protein
MISIDELVDIVRQMRTAQKNYFKTRDRGSLSLAKGLEKKVDMLLAGFEIDERNH